MSFTQDCATSGTARRQSEHWQHRSCCCPLRTEDDGLRNGPANCPCYLLVAPELGSLSICFGGYHALRWAFANPSRATPTGR